MWPLLVFRPNGWFMNLILWCCCLLRLPIPTSNAVVRLWFLIQFFSSLLALDMCPSLENANEKSNGMMGIIRLPLFADTTTHEYSEYSNIAKWSFGSTKMQTFYKQDHQSRFLHSDSTMRTTHHVDNEQIQQNSERFQFYFHLTPHTAVDCFLFFSCFSRCRRTAVMMSHCFKCNLQIIFKVIMIIRTAAVETNNNQMCESLRNEKKLTFNPRVRGMNYKLSLPLMDDGDGGGEYMR